MKDTCENCPDFADCTGICDDIKPQLEELPKRSPEISEARLNEKQRDVEKISGDTSGIDRYRQINPARVYEDAIDTEIDWEELASLQVDPTPEIVAIFNENGVDGKYLTMDRMNQFINKDVREDIDEIIDDDEDDVISLIKAELRKHLREDQIEYVYMVLGTKLFSVSLDQ